MSTKLKLSHIIFYVKHVDKALSFFKNAFDFESSFVHESGSYAEISCGSVVLAFVDEELASMNLPDGFVPLDPSAKPQAAEITLTTDDVQKAYDKALDAGAINISSPTEKPWGQTVAYIRSPQGILIELGSKIG